MSSSFMQQWRLIFFVFFLFCLSSHLHRRIKLWGECLLKEWGSMDPFSLIGLFTLYHMTCLYCLSTEVPRHSAGGSYVCMRILKSTCAKI